MKHTGVLRARIDQVGETELLDAIEPLEIRMFDQIINEFGRNCNKTVNRIVYNFSFVQRLKVFGTLA